MKINEHYITKDMEGHLSDITKLRTRPKRISDNHEAIYTDSNIQLSANAIEFTRIKSFINKIPEIREDKVEAILNEIRRGEYRVSSEEIASKLLREHITEAFLTTRSYSEREI